MVSAAGTKVGRRAGRLTGPLSVLAGRLSVWLVRCGGERRGLGFRFEEQRIVVWGAMFESLGGRLAVDAITKNKEHVSGVGGVIDVLKRDEVEVVGVVKALSVVLRVKGGHGQLAVGVDMGSSVVIQCR